MRQRKPVKQDAQSDTSSSSSDGSDANSHFTLKSLFMVCLAFSVLSTVVICVMFPDFATIMIEEAKASTYSPHISKTRLQGIEAVVKKKADTLEGLERLVNRKVGRHASRASTAAVGFTADLDVIVHVMPLVKEIGWTENMENVSPSHHDVITNEKELMETIAFFMKEGAAAERYVSNSDLFRKLCAASRKLPHSAEDLGGNGALMANRMKREGFDVTLGAPVGKTLRKFIDDGVKVVGGLNDDAHEDIHLIIEYSIGDGWESSVVAPRANRLILTSDHYNSALSPLDPFQKAVLASPPDIMVISGFQNMDGISEGREERLAKVRRFLDNVPFDTRIHFELASVSETALFKELLRLIEKSDSLGLNEQELYALHHVLTAGTLPTASPSRPGVSEVMMMMLESLKHFKYSETTHSLSRIHTHTLGFQAACDRAPKGHRWSNMARSLANASLRATKHTCADEDVNIHDTDILLPDSFRWTKNGDWQIYNQHTPVSCFHPYEDDTLGCCVAPNLVCKDPKITVGAGDNISSAGLTGHWD